MVFLRYPSGTVKIRANPYLRSHLVSFSSRYLMVTLLLGVVILSSCGKKPAGDEKQGISVAKVSPKAGHNAQTNDLLPKEKFAYHSRGKPDPFVPFIKSIPVSPQVEPVKVVGILWNNQERVALIEDSKGIGYILRVGDHLMQGKISKITENSVEISLGQWGESKRVVLELGEQKTS